MYKGIPAALGSPTSTYSAHVVLMMSVIPCQAESVYDNLLYFSTPNSVPVFNSVRNVPLRRLYSKLNQTKVKNIYSSSFDQRMTANQKCPSTVHISDQLTRKIHRFLPHTQTNTRRHTHIHTPPTTISPPPLPSP